MKRRVQHFLSLVATIAMVAAVTSAGDLCAQIRPTVATSLDDHAPSYEVSTKVYAFAHPSPHHVRLADAFRAPAGYAVRDAPKGSFAAWLADLPLRRDRTSVQAFDGRRLDSPSAAIVDMDVGARNLQQCADSAIRLHAEYLWASGRSRELAYHFTSGDEVRFTDWVRGERIAVDGSRVTRRSGAARAATHASMRRWLDLVFSYAGSRSLHRDSDTVEPSDIRPGDFFVAPGSPGHVVVVLAVAQNQAGERIALLGQGFMPAQDFHVLKADHAIDEVWFPMPTSRDDTVKTPSWRPFRGDQLRRFQP